MKSPRPLIRGEVVQRVKSTKPEKKVEAACDRLMSSLGYTAVRFSMARATMQTPGIPDRKYYANFTRNGQEFRHTFWFEAKAETKQSEYQKLFQIMVERAGEDYVCGGVPELVDYLDKKGVCRQLKSGVIEHIPLGAGRGDLAVPLHLPNHMPLPRGGPTSQTGESP